MGKSVVVSMEVTTAKSSHNCRFNKKHRICMGDARLTIKEDGSPLNYCLPCARAFLTKGLERLSELQAQVDKRLTNNAK